MYHLIILFLFLVRSCCIGDLWVQVPGLRVKRYLCIRIALEFAIPGSHREERKLICPSSNDSAHSVVRRDEISDQHVRVWVLVGVAQVHQSSMQLLTIPLRSGEIISSSTEYSTRVPEDNFILLLVPFWAIILLLSRRIITCKPAAWIAGLYSSILSSALRFGALRLA